MSLLTTDELRQHVETDLSDEALQRIIDAQEERIDDRCGASGTQTQAFSPNYSNVLFPYRKVASITSIVETVGDTSTTLAADDYRVVNGKRIDRLGTGTNPRTYWAPDVLVSYVPEGKTDQRITVLINLCKLDIEYSGLKSESIGDHSESHEGYLDEREEIIADLDAGGRFGA
jgi:hypothetical protein